MGKTVPCLYALLPNKERETYQRLTTCLKDKLKQADDILVNTIHMDFEKGLITAFSSTFPGVTISGCEFHWKNCLRKRIDAEGLLVHYNSDIKLQQLVRFIWALAYVPKHEIVSAWETVILDRLKHVLDNMVEHYSEELKTFIKYVDATWIGERNPRTSLRKKPAYQHNMWNKFSELINGQARTNNFSEGFNNGFSISLP
jgi:hypothetical protein